MPTGDLLGWRQIFADDFNVNVPLGSWMNCDPADGNPCLGLPAGVRERWGAYPDGWPVFQNDPGAGLHSPARVLSIHDSTLDYFLHNEEYSLVAAPYPIIADQGYAYGQLYGRVAVRLRADPVALWNTAFLFWPNSELWPRDGEIDFPEGSLDGTVCGFMHRQDGTWAGDQDAWCSMARYAVWHTYVTEWGPDRLRFLIDGVLLGETTSRIPNTPMHYVMQTDARDIAAPAASAHLLVDWVVVYASVHP